MARKRSRVVVNKKIDDPSELTPRMKRSMKRDQRDQEGPPVKRIKSTVRELTLVDVLNNSIIAERVTSYLTFLDMRSASAVSVDMSHSIRQTLSFLSKAVLVISNEEKSLEALLKNSTIPWRSVRIHFNKSLPYKLLSNSDVLQKTLQNVNFLSIDASYTTSLKEALILPTPAVFFDFLKSAPNLTHLQIDPRFFENVSPGYLPSFDVNLLLKNLQKLDIFKWNPNIHSRNLSGYTNVCLYDNIDKDLQKVSNLFQLTHSAASLQSLRLYAVFGRSDEDIHPIQMSVLPILANNFSTLQELVLNDVVWSLQELNTLSFPQLKRLTASVQSKEELEGRLASFIQRHKALEELDVSFNRLHKKQELWKAVKELSGKLKKFHLKVDTTSKSAEWSFLTSMTKLTDFCLEVHYFDGRVNGAGPAVLLALPENQLEKLEVGIQYGRKSFWDGGAGEISLEEKHKILMRFKSLRSLIFHNIVDNHQFQFIIKEFTRLEELEVKGSVGLTHEGVTGIKEDADGKITNTGMSVNNLTRLTRLKLTFVRSQEDGINRLLQSISLPDLKHFAYSDKEQVPEDLLLALTKNNTSLETIATKIRRPDMFLIKARLSGYRLRKLFHPILGMFSTAHMPHS